MARLILMFNKQVVKEYPLDREGVTIGRNEDNTRPYPFYQLNLSFY
jgi:hypothetical protein